MKDPAVLFYTNDFISGTFTMSDEQVGKYIRLLCLQHQKGKLSKKDMLYICKTYDVDIFSKFIEEDGYFYNKRMFEEAEKRKKYSESRKLNISKRFNKKNDNTYVEHMGNENEDENININKDKDMDNPKKVSKEYFLDLLPMDANQQFINSWTEWVDFRAEIKKKLTKSTANKQISFLNNQPNPIEVINQSIKNGWQGLFEIKKSENTKLNHKYEQPENSKYDYK